MPAPYSHDLRLRVMDAVHAGMTYEEAIRRYQVSNSTIPRWVRRLRERQLRGPANGGKKPLVLAEQRDWLLQRFAAKPDLTLRGLLAELRERDIAMSYSAL